MNREEESPGLLLLVLVLVVFSLLCLAIPLEVPYGY